MRKRIINILDLFFIDSLAWVASWYAIFCCICWIGYVYDLVPIAEFSLLLELGYEYCVGCSALIVLLLLVIRCVYKFIFRKWLVTACQRDTQ